MVRGAARKQRIRKIAEDEGVSYMEAQRLYQERGAANAPVDENHYLDRLDRCDPASGYHSMPHRGCILR